MKVKNDVYVVIPAHNEGSNIEKVLIELKKYLTNIIVVDDGSSDNTRKIVEKQKVTLLRHVINLGKGAALKTGCDYVVRKGAKKIIVMDADGQHEPRLIVDFIEALKGNEIVFGYRVASNKMPFVFRAGNFGINKITQFLYGINLRDTQCGFRAFTLDAYNKVRWDASDYSMESEMISRAGRSSLKYVEVPITTIYGDKYKGTTIGDGVKIVINLIKWRIFKSLR
jgi:glycosyltransferase involved in cell wall biosynthesis